MLLGTERISERPPHAQHIVGVKFNVIYDVVEVCLGPDKEMSPHPVADVASKINEKMIAVKSDAATCGETAIAGWAIKKHPLAAHASHEIGIHSSHHVPRKYPVKVIKNRTIFLVTVVEHLFITSSNFCAVAEVILQNTIDAETRIEPALFRWRQISFGRIGVLGGEKNANAHGNVNLLRMGESCQKKYRTRGWDKRELPQYSPLVGSFRLLGCGRQIDAAHSAVASGRARRRIVAAAELPARETRDRQFKSLVRAADSVADRRS